MIRVAETENGKVRGIEAADPRITAFKGIPFAAPPVGDLRWRAPQPAANWEGVRDCARFAPIAMQPTPGIGDNIYIREWHVDSEVPMDEDCLYLNVWTGAKDASEKRPVLVWIFGGGLQCGYPSEMEFDGERLARKGIIVVSVNYRVGAIGFLSHPELTASQPEDPANFGFLDQQAAIRWVKRNIAAFGGDPEKITIAGQSAGGGSVLSQLSCPANEGLFRGAVIMSAMIQSPYTEKGGKRSPVSPDPIADAEKKGVSFFEFLGVKTLAEARAIPAVELQNKYNEWSGSHGIMLGVIDGVFTPEDPTRLYAEGRILDVAVMSGNTGDEFPSLIEVASEDEMEARAETLFGEDAETFLAIPAARKSFEMKDEFHHVRGFAKAAGIEVTVKSQFMKRTAAGSSKPQYYYGFQPDIPGDDNPGTFHSCDLWFWFETLAKCSRAYVGRHYDLARQMSTYFANFVKNLDPNGLDADGTHLPAWEPYTDESRYEMRFTANGAIGRDHAESELVKFLIGNEMK